jgi:ATP-dependent helicase HepA
MGRVMGEVLGGIERGRFVRTIGTGLGIGQVQAALEGGLQIHYFDSISDDVAFAEVADPSTVRGVRLSPQTRCYWRTNGKWRIGRILEGDDRAYMVRFANQEDRLVPAKDLRVRWARPLNDPTDLLVAHGHESAYFHNCRQPWIKQIVQQRAACHGITSLLSSVVQFYPHQVRCVRRVLEDPLQRYLLADEVGLGKTIEAGIIIRQYLLDTPNAEVLVLTPKTLRKQWVNELTDKFLIDDFEQATLKIRSHDRWEEWDRPLDHPGMLVVDEAHHLCGDWSDPVSSARFRKLQMLASAADKLLLLSATPLLHHEASFLGMLHLLDPTLHALDDLDGFKEKVANRQAIGSLLYTLTPDTPPFLIQEKVDALRQLFPDDIALRDSLARLEYAASREINADLPASVLEVREHLSETYRLHRRLLRTRRSDEAVDVFPLRGRGQPTNEIFVDPAGESIFLLVDGLRDELVEGAPRLADSDETTDLAELVWAIAARTCSDREALGTFVNACLEPMSSSTEPNADLSPLEARLISQIQWTDRSKAMIERLAEAAKSDSLERPRIDAAIAFLRKTQARKCVVFVSYSSVAALLYQALSIEFGDEIVASQLNDTPAERLQTELDRFRYDRTCRVFVCDATAEEGLNLQFADTVLHFDLPWDVNRLEQRLGRFDRFGFSGPIRSVVLRTAGQSITTYEEAWLECLVSGFRVFDYSIASLQHPIEIVCSELEVSLLRDGPNAMVGSSDSIWGRLQHERQLIDEQDTLDAIDQGQEDQDLFDSVDNAENGWKAWSSAANNWISDGLGALRFSRLSADARPEVVTYRLSPPEEEPRQENMPLIPWDTIRDRFADLVDRPGCYQREAATRIPGVRLFRVGEPFISAIDDFTHWDDRGRAFMFWRTSAGWSEKATLLAFRFDYVIEPAPAPLHDFLDAQAEPLDIAALVRRADSFFAPFVTTIWLDVNGEPIETEATLDLLSQPYSPASGDVNLSGARAEAIRRFVSADAWERVCRTARERSESIIRDDAELARRVEVAVDTALRRRTKVTQQLRARSSDSASKLAPASVRELDVEGVLMDSVVAAVRSPLISLDTAGLVVLSSRSPQASGIPLPSE